MTPSTELPWGWLRLWDSPGETESGGWTQAVLSPASDALLAMMGIEQRGKRNSGLLSITSYKLCNLNSHCSDASSPFSLCWRCWAGDGEGEGCCSFGLPSCCLAEHPRTPSSSRRLCAPYHLICSRQVKAQPRLTRARCGKFPHRLWSILQWCRMYKMDSIWSVSL